MTQSEQFELVGRKRAEYRERKKELATLRTKAADLASTAETVAQALKFPDIIRWWDGTPFINRRSQHIVLTSAMFDALTEKNVRQIAEDMKRLNAVIASLRQELTALDEDPESGEVQR